MVRHNSFSIVLPEAPAISGLAFRHFRGAADLAEIAAVINASLAADRNSERITAEGLVNIYAHSVHWDPQQDALFVEVDGTLIGYASREWREEADGACLHFIHLHLVAEWRVGTCEHRWRLVSLGLRTGGRRELSMQRRCAEGALNHERSLSLAPRERKHKPVVCQTTGL